MDIWNINWVTCRLKSNQHRLFLSLDSISEEARKKKKNSPEYQKCWNPLNKPLHSQPSCPHWCSNFTQIYNNGTWPRPATPLSLHKSPLRLQTQTFSCRRDYFFRSPARQSRKETLACAVIKWYLIYSLHLNMNGAGLLDTSLKLVHASEHFCGPRGFVATKYWKWRTTWTPELLLCLPFHVFLTIQEKYVK